jgi:hypothetical protein
MLDKWAIELFTSKNEITISSETKKRLQKILLGDPDKIPPFIMLSGEILAVKNIGWIKDLYPEWE